MRSGDRTTLVRICDQAGRPRGTGFLADDRGTVVTSHQVLDTLTRGGHLLLHGPGGAPCPVGPGDAVALPSLGLALLRTEGTAALGLDPLPIAAPDRAEPGAYVHIAAHGIRQARVLGTTAATYTPRDGRAYPVPTALELAVGTDGRDALRSGGAAVGGPVTDPHTGAVLGVLCTALRAGHEAAGLAVPLRPGDHGPFDELLARNARTVPGYGPDLNLAGACRLTAASVGTARSADQSPPPVEREDVTEEFAAFERGTATVLGLVGVPGSGRTTELAALAARRAEAGVRAPTLWLRGADLRSDDRSVADAVARTLERSARIEGAAGRQHGSEEAAGATPERVAALAASAGRPLLVLLDGPEEMPPVLVHHLAGWTAATAGWLRAHEARMVVACRPEHWEAVGGLYPPGVLHHPARPAVGLPPAVALAELTTAQAARVRERYGIGDGAVAPGHDRHPLTLRLLAELRAVLPPDVPGTPDTEDVYAAHLDLTCARVAVRIAAPADPPMGGTAVRRLAARVAGQVHEAARRCLGPGQGELGREAFEELFPRRTGWAAAVLTEGLLVPAGEGYRFAHEDLGDWVQGAHLDLDAALGFLVHRWHTEDGPAPAPGPEGDPAPPHHLPVPRHRIGPVVRAMLLTGRRQGDAALAHRMADLIEALDRLGARVRDGRPSRPGHEDAAWWAARLLRETLLRITDARPYAGVLRVLAGRIVHDTASGGAVGEGTFAAFAPWFWRRLGLPVEDRIELLRALVPVDGATGLTVRDSGLTVRDAVLAVRHGGGAGAHGGDAARDGLVAARDGGEGFLDAVGRLLTEDPAPVRRMLCGWFTDERPLHAAAGDVPAPGGPTVASAAQALLHAHRDLDPDDLAEALVDTPHPRAEELLGDLAEDTPGTLCRAVARWARDDERPERRTAAARHAAAVLGRAGTAEDRALVRAAALALLGRTEDAPLHGPALALLVRDPETRERWLPQALRAYAQGAPGVPTDLVAEALPAFPEPVLAALRARLSGPGGEAGETLVELAALDLPALSLHTAGLVRTYLRHAGGSGDGGAPVAALVELRLEQGAAARALLLPLVASLLRDPPAPAPVRAALARTLACGGSPASRPARAELLETLMEYEQATGGDPEVLHALLRAAATGSARRPEPRTRALVHRTGTLLVRSEEGAGRFDRELVELASVVPGFAAMVCRWLAAAPEEWAAVLGAEARAALERLAASRRTMTVPMQAAGREHGSLRPA
ncbi:trypsin-like peptidase domain-containing protein [Streptomyces sp. AM 2-1-1]|uniref:trypsin-like peptidase domain-containing protein n=1 Tax=Streptomyces sp. AM 2-1-1 TaxID=3028709 RepID=UPI0023B9B5B9|nr:trypsin-like peptidase domain-containing protein [Streptomyces sp. AM 2-1-1]WEH39382.1 serine protease [Streptomyces sp. AM 2-1-1]